MSGDDVHLNNALIALTTVRNAQKEYLAAKAKEEAAVTLAAKAAATAVTASAAAKFATAWANYDKYPERCKELSGGKTRRRKTRRTRRRGVRASRKRPTR